MLVGLLLAQEVGEKHLLNLNESMLITNQVNGTYEAKYQRMQKYLEAMRKLT